MVIKKDRRKQFNKYFIDPVKSGVLNESMILKDIHKKKSVVGIQEPPIEELEIIDDDGKLRKSAILVKRYWGDGTELAQQPRFKSLSDPEKIRQFEPLFEGLKQVHSANFHHGDIKPQNILYDGSGPVIADWGDAKRKTVSETYALRYSFQEGRSPRMRLKDAQKEDLYALILSVRDIVVSSNDDQDTPTTEALTKIAGKLLSGFLAKVNPSESTRKEAKEYEKLSACKLCKEVSRLGLESVSR